LRPYSEDIRSKIVRAYENGEGSLRELAYRFDVSLSFARDLLKRFHETGSVAPKSNVRQVKSKIDEASLNFILQLRGADPKAPISTLCARLAAERHLQISRATMWRALRKQQQGKPINRTRNQSPRI